MTGKPEPRVKWTKADLVLKPDDRVTIDTKPGHSTVTVAKTKRDDSSTYIIEATNSSGRATATVDVNILGESKNISCTTSVCAASALLNLFVLVQINLVPPLPLTYLRSPTRPASWPGTLLATTAAPESPTTS